MLQSKETSRHCDPNSSAAYGDIHERTNAQLPERTMGASMSPSLKSEVGRVHMGISSLCRLAGRGDGEEQTARMLMGREIKRM